MNVLILGSTGMLGKKLVNEARHRNCKVYSMALEQADFSFDITNDVMLEEVVRAVRPDVIINTVALIDHALCEQNPGLAYRVNARPASILAVLSKQLGIRLVHISTDHFYSNDGSAKHCEGDRVTLLNEYARTKYVAELFAQQCDGALIVRTNIVGYRFEISRPTFVEWVINAFKTQASVVLFDDYFTSSIDVGQFSKILFDLIEKHCSGTLNVASTEVFSKKEFIESLVCRMGFALSNAKSGSVKQLAGAPRANSLGLDVSKAELLLGYTFPTKDQVIDRLIEEYKERNNALSVGNIHQQA